MREELASEKYRCSLNHDLQIHVPAEARYAIKSEAGYVEDNRECWALWAGGGYIHSSK